MRIYLLRHGEIDTKGKMIGQTDLPLSKLGRKNFSRMIENLPISDINALYHSPLTRCYEGAMILAQKRAIPTYANHHLKEIQLGSWENLSKAEINAQFPHHLQARGKDFTNFRPCGGESFQDLQDRVWPAFTEIIEKTQDNDNIAIIAHAGVNRVILAKILNISLNDIFSIKQEYCCINILSYQDGMFKVVSLNGSSNSMEQ